MVLDSTGRSRGDYTSLAVEMLDQIKAPAGWQPFPEIRCESSATDVTSLFEGDCADYAQYGAGQSLYV